jgi:hypothetical protein
MGGGLDDLWKTRRASPGGGCNSDRTVPRRGDDEIAAAFHLGLLVND